ncbi:MAG: M4 family metallopeptidase [Candidatus Binatus sp.]|jgi:Zn-dependent metalloprotease
MPPRKSDSKKSSSSGKAKTTARIRGIAASSSTNGLKTFAMHSADQKSAPLMATLREERVSYPAFASAVSGSPEALDPETVATRYLHQALDSKSVPALTAPKSEGVESEFKSLGTETVPLTGTTVVKFRQTYNMIPVYGSLVTVELDDRNELVSLNSSLGEPRNVSPVAKISPSQALKAVQVYPGYRKQLKGLVPHLDYYFDKNRSKWRLVFILEDVPVSRTASNKRELKLSTMYMDYVIDAETGSVVTELPRTPSMAAVVETASDGLGRSRQIRVEAGTKKLLWDSQLNIRTFDFRFADPQVGEKSLPGRDISNPPKPWSPAGVSAHANASAVSEFLRNVLRRNNIDNKGGPMNSSINCVVAAESSDGRQWFNAFWNGTQMVYGQRKDGANLLSLSVDLDVVGHEMFHGVTDHSSRLEYAGQSGALNESYSDIFGVIIANFSNADVRKWNWEVGEGLSPNGKAFRDMKDPERFGQPDHMNKFKALPNTEAGDWGGVHTNSGIHNRAAYLILTAADSSGNLILTPQEVAGVFYLALTQQLSRTSQFSDSRRGVLLAAQTLFRNIPSAQQSTKLDAISNGFSEVGIDD